MNGVAEKDHVYRPSITVSSLWKSSVWNQSSLILLTVSFNKAQSYFVYFLHGCPMIDGVR